MTSSQISVTGSPRAGEGAGQADGPAAMPPPQVAGQLDLLELARTLREAGVASVEGNADVQDRAVIDQAIRTVAGWGRPFSANDVRPLLPNVRPALVGARFLAASKAGLITRIGYVQSTDPGTHAHPIALWQVSAP